ncbi:hypothetical protein Hanom_Chr16g01451101 [Helianthus anomalus]
MTQNKYNQAFNKHVIFEVNCKIHLSIYLNWIKKVLKYNFYRVNFRLALCGLFVLMVLPQLFKNNHFPPIIYYVFSFYSSPLTPPNCLLTERVFW